ncbi:hypothetical protein [Streptomyces sp. NPDC054783]
MTHTGAALPASAPRRRPEPAAFLRVPGALPGRLTPKVRGIIDARRRREPARHRRKRELPVR